jgi:hypothetical protein
VALIKTAGVSDLVSVEIGFSADDLDTSITTLANEEPILTADNINVVINPMA